MAKTIHTHGQRAERWCGRCFSRCYHQSDNDSNFQLCVCRPTKGKSIVNLLLAADRSCARHLRYFKTNRTHTRCQDTCDSLTAISASHIDKPSTSSQHPTFYWESNGVAIFIFAADSSVANSSCSKTSSAAPCLPRSRFGVGALRSWRACSPHPQISLILISNSSASISCHYPISAGCEAPAFQMNFGKGFRCVCVCAVPNRN